MQATRPRTVRLVDFAVALVELGAIPDLSAPQTAYLETLDGKKAAPPPAVLAEFAKAGGRRFLRTIVVAHTLATTRDHVTIRDEPGASTHDVVSDALELAAAYRASTGDPLPAGELTVRSATRRPTP